MGTPLTFVAGFVAGWLTRATVDPAKSATVQIVAFGLEVVARMKRALAVERERFEDLVAEARDEAARRRAGRADPADDLGPEAAPVEHAA
jgi:CBS-domain-containing membrane protein